MKRGLRLRAEELEDRRVLSINPLTPVGDANGDGIVNGQDLEQVAAHWLDTGSGITGDVNHDNIVNSEDIAVIASNWLHQATALTPPSATAGTAFTNVDIFRFTDDDPNTTPADYSAVVNLGDGNFAHLSGTPGTNGQIVKDPSGVFEVQLSYAYTGPLTNADFGVDIRATNGDGLDTGIGNYSVAPINPATSPGAQLWLDPTDTSTMTLNNVAETAGTPTSDLQSASGTPFDFQGDGLTSQFTMAFWVYPETVWNNNSWVMANVKNSYGPNDINWVVSVPYGLGGNLRTMYATSATTTVSEDYSAAMPNPNQWYFVVITYDGSQVGTPTTQDQLRQQVYVNGKQIPTAAGESLPQKLYAAANAGKLYLGAIDTPLNNETPERFQSVGFWNHWIDSSTAAAMWNSGAGQTFATLPTKASDPFAYYEMGESSGTRFDSTSNHYDLTAGAGGVGSVTEISAWRDKSPNHVTMLFGYNPDLGVQQRNYLGIYSPTALNGTPGVILDNGAWAYATSSAITSLASGNLLMNFRVQQPGVGENEIFDFSDDVTTNEDAFLGVNYLGPAAAPDAGPNGGANTNSYVPTFHSHGGQAGLHTNGNGWASNVVNINGPEFSGQQVAGNTYLAKNGVYSYEFSNDGDGSQASGSNPGPYRMWIDDQPQTLYVADTSGHLNNLWGNGYVGNGQLSCITLGGLASRDSHGAWQISTGTGNVIGDVMEFGPAVTGVEDAALRQYLDTREGIAGGGSAIDAAAVDQLMAESGT